MAGPADDTNSVWEWNLLCDNVWESGQQTTGTTKTVVLCNQTSHTLRCKKKEAKEKENK